MEEVTLVGEGNPLETERVGRRPWAELLKERMHMRLVAAFTDRERKKGTI